MVQLKQCELKIVERVMTGDTPLKRQPVKPIPRYNYKKFKTRCQTLGLAVKIRGGAVENRIIFFQQLRLELFHLTLEKAGAEQG